jgi:hypothetical protein
MHGSKEKGMRPSTTFFPAAYAAPGTFSFTNDSGYSTLQLAL